MFMRSGKRIVLFGVGGIVLMLGVALALTSRAERTQSYFKTYRTSFLGAPAPLRPLLGLAEYAATPLYETLGIFEPVWTQVQPGLKMRLDPYDLVSRTILETGVWEPQSLQSVADHLSQNATFIDVGAHIGYYSLRAANWIGQNGHVIAVEPNPQTLPKLRGNIAANDARAVTVWPVACSDRESTLELYAAPERNTGESSLSKENASQEGSAVTAYSVRARPLDAIVKESKVDRVDVIKIDVEGAELQVLKGAAQTLTDYRPVLVIELEPAQLKSMGASVEEVTQFLASHGYGAGRRVDHSNFEFVPQKTITQVHAR
jgi:FkbM family methyltransferase